MSQTTIDPQPKPMNRTCSESTVSAPAPGYGQRRFRVMLTALASLAAVVALAVSGCKKAAPTQLPAPLVEVMEVVATNAPAAFEFIGQLDSPQNVEVRARVEAFVDKMLFTEGTEVKEGDPLFELDNKPYQERLAAANGMLAEAKAALNKYEKDVARLTPAGREARHPAAGPRQRRRLGGRRQGERALRAGPGGVGPARSRLLRRASAHQRADWRQAGVRSAISWARANPPCWPPSPRSIPSGSIATSAKSSISRPRPKSAAPADVPPTCRSP